MTPHAVRAVVGDDHDHLVGVMTRAFAHDPCFSWVFRREDRRGRDLSLLFRTAWAALVPHGISVTTSDRAGVALWAPPGRHQPDESVTTTFGAEMAAVYEPGAMQRLLEFFALTDAHHPTEPHYYLGVLAADDGRQGQGLGSSCLQAVLEREVDRTGAPAYLESSNDKNVPLYERHGFEVVGIAHLSGSASAGPPLFFMWRSGRIR